MIMQIGSINLMLLQALKDSSKYGVEIVKYISDATDGAMDIKQPSLYSGLNRLEKRGLISSYWQDSDIGGRRHYYTITELGLTQLKLHAAEIQSIMSGVIPDIPDEDVEEITVVTEDLQDNDANNVVETVELADTEEEVEDQVEDITATRIDTQSEQDFSPIDIDSLLNIDTTDTKSAQSINGNFDEQRTTLQKDISIQQDSQDTQQNTQSYAEYKPNKHNISNKSFSQKMRAYVEPKNDYSAFEAKKTTELVDTPIINTTSSNHYSTPTFDNIHSSPSTPIESATIKPRETSFINNDQETTVEYTRQDSNTIDYKNILGELDAELNTYTPNTIQSIESTNTIPNLVTPQIQTTKDNTAPQKKSVYSQQLASILSTAKSVNNITNTKHQNNIGNQQRLDELNRKYDGCAELKCSINAVPEKNIQDINVAQNIQSKKTGYSNIAQDSITIKPYVKQDKNAQTDKSYLFINKFNLIRTFIMFVIMCLELGGMYWYFADSGILSTENSSAYIVFIVSAVLICMYVGLMLAFNVPNLQKIVLRNNVSWKSDFFYRLLLTVIMITFVIALNTFLGMSAFDDPTYIIQWLVPSVMIFNITLSGILGYIMNLFKIQCK